MLTSDDLITVLARVKHRLQSDQKAKWKRIRKTMQLIEFLMKNGSIEFVAVMAEKFKCYVEPYLFYEFTENYEDCGYPSLLTSPRVCPPDSGALQGQGEDQKGAAGGQKVAN